MKKGNSILQYGIYADHKKAFIFSMDKDDAINCEKIKSEIIALPRIPREQSIRSTEFVKSIFKNIPLNTTKKVTSDKNPL